MPIRYAFDGFAGLGYSVTACVVAAAVPAAGALPDADSCDGCVPRPHPRIATAAIAITARLVIRSFMASPSMAALSSQVDVDRADDDCADDNVLNVRGDLHEVQAVPENTKHE